VKWFVVMKCGRCRKPLRRYELDVADDGTFKLDAMPSRCTNKSCQAGFGVGTDYSLNMTIYKSQMPTGE